MTSPGRETAKNALALPICLARPTFHAVGDQFDDTFRNWVDTAAAVGCNALFSAHVIDGEVDMSTLDVA